ncbi:unnamed protein product [Gordionus sp. m RMFG-2023]
MKIAQICIALIGFICSTSSKWAYAPGTTWYDFVSFSGFIISLILLIFYVLQIVAMGRPLSNLPWFLIEFIFCATWAFFFLIASLVLAIRSSKYPCCSGALAAAAFFGFVAMILYGYDAFLKMRMWKAGEIPTAISNRAGPTTTSSVTLPA